MKYTFKLIEAETDDYVLVQPYAREDFGSWVDAVKNGVGLLALRLDCPETEIDAVLIKTHTDAYGLVSHPHINIPYIKVERDG